MYMHTQTKTHTISYTMLYYSYTNVSLAVTLKIINKIL